MQRLTESPNSGAASSFCFCVKPVLASLLNNAFSATVQVSEVGSVRIEFQFPLIPAVSPAVRGMEKAEFAPHVLSFARSMKNGKWRHVYFDRKHYCRLECLSDDRVTLDGAHFTRKQEAAIHLIDDLTKYGWREKGVPAESKDIGCSRGGEGLLACIPMIVA